MSKPINVTEVPAPANILRQGDVALRLGACFGVNRLFPVPVPVWVVDDNRMFSDCVTMLRSADDGDSPDYADLQSGKKASGLQLFFAGTGYRSPEPMLFEDRNGVFTQNAQFIV